jgi:hypothetical protein
MVFCVISCNFHHVIQLCKIWGFHGGDYFFLWGGTKSTRYCSHFWPIVQAPDDRWGWLWSNWWNEDCKGKPKYSEKTCPSATLSTTNPTWPDPGSNAGRRGGKPATNRMRYGAAFLYGGDYRMVEFLIGTTGESVLCAPPWRTLILLFLINGFITFRRK